jgi:hypothetical protein
MSGIEFLNANDTADFFDKNSLQQSRQGVNKTNY